MRRAFLSVVFASFMCVGSLVAGETAATPVEFGGKEAAAYVVVPDVNALFTAVDVLAKQFAPPGQYAPGMAKLIVGAQLGDAALDNLGKTPLMLVLFKLPEGYQMQPGAPPPMALFMPAIAAQPYDQVFNAKGVSAFENGVLIAAPTAELLKKAQAMRADYDKLAAAKPATDIRLFISGASLMDTYGSMLASGLKETEKKAIDSITNEPPPPGVEIKPEMAIKLVKMGLRGVDGLLHQINSMQLDLKVTPEALTMDMVFAAKEGSILASFMSNGAAKTDKNLEALVGNGSLAGTTSMDMVALSAAWKKLVAEVAANPDYGDLAKNEMVAFMQEALDSVGGAQAFSMQFSKDGMSQTMAGTVKNPAAYLEMLKKTNALFDKDSMIGKLYAGMGMTMISKFEEKARAYKGVDIARMTMTMDGPMFKGPQKEQMDKMMKPREIAIVKGYFLSSDKPETLNAMIDMTTSGTFSPNGMTLKSKAAFGEGRQFYVDYDFLALMKAVSADPNNPMGPIFAKLPDGAPVLIAGSMDKGKLQISEQIPLAPIAKMVKMFMEMGQAMQQGNPVPPPKPTEDGKF